MLYLDRFYIFENLQQAKTVLLRNNILETDVRFQELKLIFNKNIGYLGWATTQVFQNNIDIDSIKNIYNIIINESEIINKLNKPVIDYNNFEELLDDINKIKIEIKAKRIYNEFTTIQKNLINIEDKQIQFLLSKLYDSEQKSFLISKISRYKTTKDLLDAINSFVNTSSKYNFDIVKKELQKENVLIVYDNKQEDIIIAEFKKSSQLSKICSDTSWCILGASMFDRYTSGGKKQYVIFSTDVPKSNIYSRIGLTLDGVRVDACHLANDQLFQNKDLIKYFIDRNLDLEKIIADIYFRFAEFELKNQGPYFHISTLKNNIDKIKDELKTNHVELVSHINELSEIEKLKEKANELFRDLTRYGYEYKHVIDEAKSLDINKLHHYYNDVKKLFYIIAITKQYEKLDYLDIRISCFLYSDSSAYHHLGFEIMEPIFKYCLINTEIFWEYSDRELAILYLIFAPKLLKDRVDNGDSPEFLISLLNMSFENLLATLILYNRKESFAYFIDTINTKESFTENETRTLKYLTNVQLYANRIKRGFKEHNFIKKGLFKEEPDYDFFLEKRKDLTSVLHTKGTLKAPLLLPTSF